MRETWLKFLHISMYKDLIIYFRTSHCVFIPLAHLNDVSRAMRKSGDVGTGVAIHGRVDLLNVCLINFSSA